MPWNSKIPDLKNNPAYLEPRITVAESQLADIAINVRQPPYNAKANGVDDDTLIIQTAIDTGRTILVPKATYIIDPTRLTYNNPGNQMVAGLFPKSNQRIIFEPGAIFKAKTNSADRYSIFGIYNVDNVFIENATLRGDRSAHTGTTGEWGYGVYVQSSDNVVLKDCQASDFWGDGFNVGCTDHTNAASKSTNIKLIDCSSDNNRRQGLSVTGADNVTVLRGKYSSTNGTEPSSGIDFEPDNIATKNTNCKVIDVDLMDNILYGIMATQNGNIVVERCHFKGNGTSSLYVTADNKIKVKNCIFENEEVIHLQANTNDLKFIDFEDNEILLSNTKGLMSTASTPVYLGEINWINNRITYTGTTGITLFVYGNSDSQYISKFKCNTVKVPAGFDATNLTSGNILVYSDDNVQVSENEFNNQSTNSLRLYNGGTKAFYGKPNRYVGNILDDAGKANGDIHATTIAIGNVASMTTAIWANIPVLSAQLGDYVEIIPSFDTKGLIFTYDIIAAGYVNIHVFNPTASAINVNNPVDLNIESRRIV